MNDLLPTRSTSTSVATVEGLDPETEELLRRSVAPSTWRAYGRDLVTIEEWCRGRGERPIPATPATVANYIAGNVRKLTDSGTEKGLAASTIERRVAAWSTWHTASGIAKEQNPCRSGLVRKALSGLRRGAQTPKQATPLLVDDLRVILDVIPATSLVGLRDRALLTVGLALGRRRSELVALDVEDLHRVESPRPGYSVLIRRSKTDQEGQGSTVWLPRTGSPLCPSEALDRWIAAASITTGPVFRSVTRYGVIGGRLSDRSVSTIVARWAKEAELPPGSWSGHSLRAGFVTDHAIRGASTRSIANQTGHSPTSPVIHRYVRRATPWEDNAAAEGGWL